MGILHATRRLQDPDDSLGVARHRSQTMPRPPEPPTQNRCSSAMPSSSSLSASNAATTSSVCTAAGHLLSFYLLKAAACDRRGPDGRHHPVTPFNHWASPLLPSPGLSVPSHSLASRWLKFVWPQSRSSSSSPVTTRRNSSSLWWSRYSFPWWWVGPSRTLNWTKPTTPSQSGAHAATAPAYSQLPAPVSCLCPAKPTLLTCLSTMTWAKYSATAVPGPWLRSYDCAIELFPGTDDKTFHLNGSLISACFQ